MGLEYYAFALFVAGLICAIAIICKVLFANVKRQQKLLDERESQILQLYTSVETLMEEFSDQVKLISAELKEHEYRATSHIEAFDLPPELEKKERIIDRLPRNVPYDANRLKVAGEVLERAERIIKSDAITSAAPPSTESNGPVFQKFFDETAEAPPSPPPKVINSSTISFPPNTQARSDMILSLASEGKSDAEIASELGITRNEVQLVIGLKK